MSFHDILIFAYNFWAPVIMVPLAFALLGSRTFKSGFTGSFAAGLAGSVMWKYVFNDPFGFDGLVFGVFCSLAGFLTFNHPTKNYNK